jgi:hypothetical protein
MTRVSLVVVEVIVAAVDHLKPVVLSPAIEEIVSGWLDDKVRVLL